MSYFICPHCRERTDLFAHGGGETTANRLQVPFLGEVPLNIECVKQATRESQLRSRILNLLWHRRFCALAERVAAGISMVDLK